MTSLKSAWRGLVRLHQSEQGAEGLEKVLIIAAIVLPLLAVLLIFRRAITEWINNAWQSMTGSANNIQQPAPQAPATP